MQAQTYVAMTDAVLRKGADLDSEIVGEVKAGAYVTCTHHSECEGRSRLCIAAGPDTGMGGWSSAQTVDGYSIFINWQGKYVRTLSEINVKSTPHQFGKKVKKYNDGSGCPVPASKEPSAGECARTDSQL